MGTKPPAHLSEASAAWWNEVVGEYGLEGYHLELLKLACESLDRAEQARAFLAANGLTFKDRLGNPRPFPEVAIERDSRLVFARLLKQLGLDMPPPPDPNPRGRPAYHRREE